MNAPRAYSEPAEAAATPSPDLDQSPPQSAIPLLSEVVIPGAAVAEAADTISWDTRSSPADPTASADQRLLEQLLPKVGELIAVSVREALSGASDQIVRNVLIQLRQKISTVTEEIESASRPPPPDAP